MTSVVRITNRYKFTNKQIRKFVFNSLFVPLLFIFFSSTLSTKAQDKSASKDTSDNVKSNFLRYEDHVYIDNIHTVQLAPVGGVMATPMIRLNTPDKLLLSFDDLDADTKTYTYTFVHCDADWTPSDMDKANYLTGYTDENLETYRNSFNTNVKYTHYELSFPTEGMKPTISGNYVIIVYSDFDPNKIVLTKRFMIYEQLVSIDAHIHRATIIDDRDAKQKVDFSVLYDKYKIDNPFDEIKIVITQNDRWDNAITNLKPLFLKDKLLDYSYDKENTFNGGNEFRFFDTRSFQYMAEHIYRFAYDSVGNHHTFLDQDQRRSSKHYLTEPDINGRYLIHIENGNDANVEGDYTLVHFSLPMSEPVTGGNIYLFGGFTDWEIGNKTKMIYNYPDASYHAAILLKQGYFNYEYVFVKDGSKVADESYIEGSHWETENDYTIYVYDKPMGSRYDMLIGVKRVNSIKG